MYRDTASTLDEHDRAVGAILIGEALVETCEQAQAVERSPRLHDSWRAFAEASVLSRGLAPPRPRAQGARAARPQHRRLRRAAAARRRSRSPAARRSTARRSTKRSARSASSSSRCPAPTGTRSRLAPPASSARRSRAEQQQRSSSARPPVALLGARVSRRSSRAPADAPRGDARRTRQIAQQRKLKIPRSCGSRWARVASRPRRTSLVKLLVLDGRGPDAKAFGADYVVRCGEDEVVEHLGART